MCFVRISWFSQGRTSPADFGVSDINSHADHTGLPLLHGIAYTSTRPFLGDFVNAFHRYSSHRANWRRDCWSSGSGCAKRETAWSRFIEFLQFYKQHDKGQTDYRPDYLVTWLRSSGRVVSFGRLLQRGARNSESAE